MAQSWRGQDAILSITDASDENVPVAVLQDVEVTKESETSELRGSGSVKRKDVQQTEVNITVTGTVAEWDFDAWKTLIDYDTASSEIKDSSSIPLFDVDVDITESGTDTADTIRVKDVYFPDLTVSGSRDEYLEMDLDGNGKDIETNPT